MPWNLSIQFYLCIPLHRMDSSDKTHLLPLWMMDFTRNCYESEDYFLSLLPDYVHEIIITWIFVKWNRL